MEKIEKKEEKRQCNDDAKGNENDPKRNIHMGELYHDEEKTTRRVVSTMMMVFLYLGDRRRDGLPFCHGVCALGSRVGGDRARRLLRWFLFLLGLRRREC